MFTSGNFCLFFFWKEYKIICFLCTNHLTFSWSSQEMQAMDCWVFVGRIVHHWAASFIKCELPREGLFYLQPDLLPTVFHQQLLTTGSIFAFIQLLVLYVENVKCVTSCSHIFIIDMLITCIFMSGWLLMCIQIQIMLKKCFRFNKFYVVCV